MISTATATSQHNEDDYERFLSLIGERFADESYYGKSLFTTDTADLFDVFLEGLSENERQHYRCNTCRKFVNLFGGLVTITSEGETVPAVWPVYVPRLYLKSTVEIRRLIAKARVTGVFFNAGATWGNPVTGDWHHMAVIPNGFRFDDPLRTPHQAMAAKREDYKTLLGSLLEFPLEAVEQALRVLDSEALYRSEKVLGVARWFRKVHRVSEIKSHRARNNLRWLAVASAPAGFCHIKSSMIGSLLGDIVAGLPFDVISRRFSDRIHPLQYQRPQVAPTAGNIVQAEKTIEKLKAAGSLERRFARLDELELIWWTAAPDPKPAEVGGGVFSHLTPKESVDVSKLNIPIQTVTWRKFNETVLDTADYVSFYVPPGRHSYTALVTAASSDAPPILQWDMLDQRNPVSHYMYTRGSAAEDWGLTAGKWHPVTGVCFKPSMWTGGKFAHHGEGVVFILNEAMDSKYENSGNALFPEILKSEFRPIRATIEAYSKTAVLRGADRASACGISLAKGDRWDFVFRVFTGGAETDYRLDRWD